MKPDESTVPSSTIRDLRENADRLHQQGRYVDAIALYEQLIHTGHADALTWFAHGDACASLGQFARSLGGYRRCLSFDGFKDAEQARHQLGRAYYQLGMVDEAVKLLRQALANSRAIITEKGLATIIPGAPSATHADVLNARTTYANSLARLGSVKSDGGVPLNASQSDKVRVGYLSSYFSSANYMKPVWAAINHHNRQSFEWHLLIDDTPEAKLDGYRAYDSDVLHFVGADSNQHLFDRIRDLQLDVLVDLNSYSTPARLELFVHQPAVNAVSWFNAFATSGLPGIHFQIGDRACICESERQFYTERIINLPMSYLSFEVNYETPPVAPPPSLKNRYITFGSLVSQYKITPPVLDAWSEILHRTGSSKLLLANPVCGDAGNQTFVREQFQSRGIDPERLHFLGPASHLDYLRNYEKIDIALDSFPYSGGTTTMEAIWQGVPVLTFSGDRWAARTSASLLTRSYLRQFVTPSLSGLIRQAVELANSSSIAALLEKTRAEMCDRLMASSVMNGRGLARHLERVYSTLAGRT